MNMRRTSTMLGQRQKYIELRRNAQIAINMLLEKSRVEKRDLDVREKRELERLRMDVKRFTIYLATLK